MRVDDSVFDRRGEVSMQNEHDARHAPAGILPTGRAAWVLLGFLGVAAYFLWTEHRAHVVSALPWLLLLACPLMHVFMHRGHGGHGSRSEGDAKRDTGSEGAQR
jgi:hypothetical protein